MKAAVGIMVALLLIIPGLFYVYSMEDDDDGAEHSYESILTLDVETTFDEDLTNLFFVIDLDPTISDPSAHFLMAATLTPLIVQSNPDNEFYNPVVFGTEEKGVDSLTELTPRTVVTLDPAELDATIYLQYYNLSSVCFMVNNYEQALAASPVAAYLGIPIFSDTDDNAKSVMDSLGVDTVLVIGNANHPKGSDFIRIKQDELNNLLIDLLEQDGLTSDYIVVTNPNDIVDYQELLSTGHLPVPGTSLLAAELAAYHRAPMYFSQGLPSIDVEYGDGFTQLGVSREENNYYAEQILGRVHEGVELLNSSGMEAVYLGLVGGPVTLPMFSWDINDYQQERQYTPSDYYYGNLNEDPYQELAVGRIFARSLCDASLMLARSLAFDEINQYSYPKDDSSTVYDSVSEDWKENSLACVGTTKIGPGPGILTPTLANQTRTMSEAGYHVTSMGYDLATQAEIVKEIIDEMNYAVYYGHGDYDCWYSTVPDPIDSDMINGQDLKPGFAIAMACLTGMTDSVDIPLDQMLSLAFLHSGYTGYIGATRVAYGLYDYEISEDGAIRGTGALYLVDIFSDVVCSEDMDVGLALMYAKNALIETQGWEGDSEEAVESRITVTQYVLYGDPANNLWVPDRDS